MGSPIAARIIVFYINHFFYISLRILLTYAAKGNHLTAISKRNFIAVPAAMERNFWSAPRSDNFDGGDRADFFLFDVSEYAEKFWHLMHHYSPGVHNVQNLTIWIEQYG